MTRTHNAPYDVCHVPLHWLTKNKTKLWLLGGQLRRQMASELSRLYRTGCGVLSETLFLIAYVDPRGGVRDLPPPFRRFEAWQVANKPDITGCPCMSFVDPETQGPWRARMAGRDPAQYEHHPLCQFDAVSQPVFNELLRRRLALGPVDRDHPVDVRPDEWTRVRAEYRGK